MASKTAPAWRLIKKRYASTAFTGEGSRLHGSRWTGRGVRVTYASSSLSLATLETLVHLQKSMPLNSYVVFTLEIPRECIAELKASELPANWREFPAPPETRSVGNEWARRGDTLALRVPSAVIPNEFNYLINPAHSDFARIEISKPVSFEIDPRLPGGG